MGLIIEIIFTLIIVFIILTNIRVRNLYRSLKEETNESNLSGFEIVRNLSDNDPHIIKKNGMFLDHYNSERNTVKLSNSVFDGEDIYAGLIAVNIAFETKNNKVAKNNKFNSLLILTSYVVIILGAFLSKTNIINFGLIVFIVAFWIEILNLNKLFNNEEYEHLLTNVIKDNIIKPEKDKKDYFLLVFLTRFATLPYSFIKYFK